MQRRRAYFGMLFLYTFSSNLSQLIITESILPGNSVNMICPCNTPSKSSLIWLFNERIMFVESLLPSEFGFSNVNGSLADNEGYSRLHVYDFSDKNIGVYTCHVENSIQSTYNLVDEVGKLKIYLNDYILEKSKYIIAERMYKVRCTEHDVQYNEVNIVRITLNTTSLSKIGREKYETQTFLGIKDAAIQHFLTKNTSQLTVSCRRQGINGNLIGFSVRSLLAVVVPDLRIIINGVNVSGAYTAERGANLSVECIAFGTKPKVLLTWQTMDFADDNYTVLEENYNIHHLSTVDYKIHLETKLENNIDITCLMHGPTEILDGSVTIRILAREPHRIVLIFAISGGAILCAVITVIYYRRRGTPLTLLQQTRLRATQTQVVHGGSSVVVSTQDLNASCSVENSKHGPVKMSCGLQKQNVSLIHIISSGKTFDYWEALDNSRKVPRIVAKTVSGKAQMNDGYHFLKLVSYLRSIKQHQNIVECLGFATESVPYYVYHEFLENGTLRDFLLKHFQPQWQQGKQCQDNEISEKQSTLIKFAKDVANGIEFLHINKLCHPALASRKVLLGTNYVCKLFDFWPIEISGERVKNLSQKKNPPTAWFPPETLFLNTYGFPSDVWAFGVLMWELFSYGETPYHHKRPRDIERSVRNVEHLKQPPLCPGALYSVMLTTWDMSCEERPTMTEVKNSIKEVYENVTQCGISQSAENRYFTLELGYHYVKAT